MANGGFFTACRDNAVSVITGWPANGERAYCICIPLYFVKAGAFDIFPFIYEKNMNLFSFVQANCFLKRVTLRWL